MVAIISSNGGNIIIFIYIPQHLDWALHMADTTGIGAEFLLN